MSTVSIKNVTKAFDGGTRAVDNVSLDVEEGEFLVLLGPSGCGKTTLLRMIAGLEDISSGELYIGDRLVNHDPPKDRDIAMVFQSYALYPHMTVDRNLSLGLTLRKVDRPTITERLTSAAKTLGIGHLRSRLPGQLSGGQQQRVALGRAIVRVPKVFLMDEPLSNLDSRLRINTRTELVKLHRRLGVTTIYVTHDQGEAMTMATRVVVMKDGVVQQVGTPIDIYRAPANKFVAGFLGSPEMNFLEAKVIRESGDAWAVGDGFRLRLPDSRLQLVDAEQADVLWLGMRPETLAISAEPLPGLSMAATVDVVEPLGRETLVYCTVGSGTVVVGVEPGNEPVTGQEINVAVDPGRLHAFSYGTEQTLW